MHADFPSSDRFERCETRARNADLLSRDVLTPTERHAVALGALAAAHLDEPELVRELAVIARDGATPEFVEDMLIQMAAYVGYPRARRLLAAYGRVARLPRAGTGDDGPTDEVRYARGIGAYAEINDQALATIEAAFGAVAGDVIGLTFRAFGDVFATSSQPLAVRQLATVAALAVLGGAAPQLKFHLGAALNVGVPVAKLVETIAWVQYAAGMPAAYNALVELKNALSEGADAPPAYAA